MSDQDRIWTYRVLAGMAFDERQAPLETGHLLGSTATREEAARRFIDLREQGVRRLTSPSGRLKPGAIEFLDPEGVVRVSYTEMDWRADGFPKPED